MKIIKLSLFVLLCANALNGTFVVTSFAQSSTKDNKALLTQGSAQLKAMAGHKKLVNGANVAQSFLQNAATVQVLVTLKADQTTVELSQRSLRAQQRLGRQNLSQQGLLGSVNAHDEPQADAGPAKRYYDLKDKSIRKQLKAAVTAQLHDFETGLQTQLDQQQRTVGFQVPGQADLARKAVAVKKRFAYMAGFSAEVTQDGLQALLDSDLVESVTENYSIERHLAQGIPTINATAPRAEYGGAGVAIAIVDDGLENTHPDLDGDKTLGGFDFADNDADFTPTGTHGTAVAGIAAGDANITGDYIGGVAPDAKLYGLKVFTDTGNGSLADVIEAWEWAVSEQDSSPENPILVINASLGIADNAFTSVVTCEALVPAMTAAAANLWNAGISNFVSSGNDGFCSGISYPSCLSQVNSVGAVYDANVGVPGFCVSASSCLTTIDVASCPSGKAFVETSTTANQVTAYSNASPLLTMLASADSTTTTEPSGGHTSNFGGTSAASPYAAGAAAVLQSAAMAKMGRHLTPQEVLDYMTDNGVEINDNKSGITKPRIDLTAAVAALPNFNVPDLTVTSQFNGDAFVLPSTEVNLLSNIANISQTAATASTARLYLSTDVTISNTDMELLTQSVSALSGQTNLILPEWSVTVPDVAGVYYYGFCVDVVQDEEVIDNNCSAAITVNVNPEGTNPDLDLFIENLAVNDLFATPAQALIFSGTVRNDGLAASAGTTVRFLRSSDAIIETDDLLVQSQIITALESQTSSTSLSFSVNASAVAGLYYYGFCVDSVDNESNENNNCSAALTVEVNEFGEAIVPDLLPTLVSIDDRFATPEQLLSLTSQFSNFGQQAAEESIVRLLQSSDNVIEPSDSEVNAQLLSPLAAQADSSTFNWSIVAPLEEGQYYYGFCVDAVTDELNVANNCSVAVEVLVNQTGEEVEDELCFPIKARNGNVAVICL